MRVLKPRAESASVIGVEEKFAERARQFRARPLDIRGVILGQSGEMTVNGKPYNGTMIPLNYLSDDDVANVLTYVRSAWGNDAPSVTPRDTMRRAN